LTSNDRFHPQYHRGVVSLAELEREASVCTRCPLAAGRTNVVFGVGDANADLMFVGEGPGRDEDLKGEPFVGRSGQLLDQVLQDELGIGRDRVYISNVVKCLRYNAPVQLGDGSWERVGRLVRSRYDGTVMSVDAEGRLVPRRVVGWHASPLGDRRVFRLTYRSAKPVGASRVGIELTGDHGVLTDQGWSTVENLWPGARIATGQGLSPLARDVAFGTLLGDGHLSTKSSHLSFSHSGRQGDYAAFKAEALAELQPRSSNLSVSAVAGETRTYPIVVTRTRAHRALRLLRREFYDGVKTVPSWIPETLNARMLAVWFMDDGHLRVRPGRKPLAEIATCCFGDQDLEILVEALVRLGLPATTARHRLYFNASTIRQLSETVAPYVPPSMRYKLHPEVSASVPFDPSLMRAGPPEVMYDEVDVEEVSHDGRTDKTFFCIDVDETHNFVTAGGVVHNCRPPGNRDPHPVEVASCRPYLESQIDLIRPRVIVTLGNFATRLLLDSTRGIKQLRGRAYPYEGSGGNVMVVPTFHPSFVLRSGGVGEAMAGLRADLVRAKQFLRAAAP